MKYVGEAFHSTTASGIIFNNLQTVWPFKYNDGIGANDTGMRFDLAASAAQLVNTGTVFWSCDTSGNSYQGGPVSILNYNRSSSDSAIAFRASAAINDGLLSYDVSVPQFKVNKPLFVGDGVITLRSSSVGYRTQITAPILGKLELIGDGSTVLNTPMTTTSGSFDAASYKVGGTTGASGSFTTADGKTVTVTNGLITSIV